MNGKGCLWLIFGLIVLVAIGDWSSSNRNSEPQTAATDTPAPKADALPDLASDDLAMAEDERAFLLQLREFRTQSFDGKNDLARSDIMDKYKNEFCNSLIKNRKIHNWIGIVKYVSSSQYVTINITSDKYFRGWKGENLLAILSFNEEGKGKKFLESISEGDKVTFSGTIQPAVFEYGCNTFLSDKRSHYMPENYLTGFDTLEIPIDPSDMSDLSMTN